MTPTELTCRAMQVLADLPKHLQWDIGLDPARGEFWLPVREARALERLDCLEVLTKRRAKLTRVQLTDLGREIARLRAEVEPSCPVVWGLADVAQIDLLQKKAEQIRACAESVVPAVRRVVEPSRIRRGRMATAPVWYVGAKKFNTRKEAVAFRQSLVGETMNERARAVEGQGGT